MLTLPLMIPKKLTAALVMVETGEGAAVRLREPAPVRIMLVLFYFTVSVLIILYYFVLFYYVEM